MWYGQSVKNYLNFFITTYSNTVNQKWHNSKISHLPHIQLRPSSVHSRASPKAEVRADCGNALMMHHSKSSRMLHILLLHVGKIHWLLYSVVLSALQLRHQQSAYTSRAEGCLSCTFPHLSYVWAVVSKAVNAQVLPSQRELNFTSPSNA